MPVTSDYEGTQDGRRAEGRRWLTPLALVVIAVFATDVVFAVDSVPAVYGITGDPYLVFATNAFALLGLRALYFVLQGALAKLVHLSYGLAAILGFIGVKLVLHWAHGVWPSVPSVPTLASLGVIVGDPRDHHDHQPDRLEAGRPRPRADAVAGRLGLSLLAWRLRAGSVDRSGLRGRLLLLLEVAHLQQRGRVHDVGHGPVALEGVVPPRPAPSPRGGRRAAWRAGPRRSAPSACRSRAGP